MALFAGAGGGILGSKILGWRTVCAVEYAPFPRSVLLARQRDGYIPRFPIWDDVQTFDGRPWRGHVDVVTGGFPCQDISSAGKGAGIEGERSGLWSEMARIIGEVRPRFAFVENSPNLTFRELGVVLGDLATMGFDAEWGVLGASAVGAPHRRDRIWIAARALSNPMFSGLQGHRDKHGLLEDCEEGEACGSCQGEVVADADLRDGEACGAKCQGGREGGKKERSRTFPWRGGCDLGAWGRWWGVEPDVGRMAHGVDSRMDRLKAIGNGQVPICAAYMFEMLRGRLEKDATHK